MAKFRTLTGSNTGKDIEQQEHPFITSGNGKWYSHFGRELASFFHNSTYDAAVVLLGIYAKELEN